MTWSAGGGGYIAGSTQCGKTAAIKAKRPTRLPMIPSRREGRVELVIARTSRLVKKFTVLVEAMKRRVHRSPGTHSEGAISADNYGRGPAAARKSVSAASVSSGFSS